jgi:DNA mismatch repair protein MutS
MMQQYHQAKAASPGAILLFRMGDFYELFHDDARRAAEILGLALTTRDKDKGDAAVPMAGFPHPALEGYLAKLIAAGQRVAIAEQVEDPKQAKGLVRREVKRIVSPGTLTDDALLDPRRSNFLAAVRPGKLVGLAWIEMSTGRFHATEVAPDRLADELARIDPVEILIGESEDKAPPRPHDRVLITQRPDEDFEPQSSAERLAKHYGTHSLEGFGWTEASPAIGAAGAVLAYLNETQRDALPHLGPLVPFQSSETLQIDESTRRSLELTRTIRDGRREGSLLGVLDRTVTAPGSRMLCERLANPLASRPAIDERLDAVGELLNSPELTSTLRDLLRETFDLERLLARVTAERAGPRDLTQIAMTLRLLPRLKAKLTARTSSRLQRIESDLDLCAELRSALDAALSETCPLFARDGGFIKPGFHSELDELRELAKGGKQWIAKYQAEEAERTGINHLKVGFNKVFGYYLEISNTQRSKVPAEYIRKQTVKSAERYITPELKEYEEKVLSAEDRAQALEVELFEKLRSQTAAAAVAIHGNARLLAELDVLASLATLAAQRGYCRPDIIDEPVLEIIEGRHPVLDCLLPAGEFVPNDTNIGQDAGHVLLITGPNMAGKSTYIRQVALITLLAQMGSYVPATRARIGIADRIFARVGASDELSRGQSTFMVEMTETARILHTATSRSLVILDEIGRGTSTYDGVSLAWAVTEYLHNTTGARTLFATHYHELTQLSDDLTGVRNYTVAVREWQGKVVFLHRIEPGAADRSYGIHVAELAGVPTSVLDRANAILRDLESQPHHRAALASPPPPAPVPESTTNGHHAPRRPSGQRLLFAVEQHPIVEELLSVDVDLLDAETALELLKELRDKAEREG